MAMPICPIHQRAMRPGADGIHRCQQQPGDTFVIEAGPPPAEAGARRCYGNMPCPDRACGGELEQERPGRWRCTSDPRHVFMVTCQPASAPPKAPAPQSTAPARNAEREQKPQRFWLSHIGLAGPLLPPPQSNAGDGTYCQPLGDTAPGGGSKSGRKKPKPKKLREELWGV